MEPLVSIVVPVYRVEKYLDLCVQSLLTQTYANLEIILVDDGSPDECPAMCDAYAQQDSRVKVIHKENGGLSDARNAGVEAAAGQYITFVDGDDILAPGAVAEMVALAQKEQADIVKLTLERKTPAQQRTSVPGGYAVISGVDALGRIYTDKPQIISACGKLFQRELLRDVRFPVGRYYEDEFTTPKLYYLAERVVLSESVMYFYMQWENESIMRTALTQKKITDSLFMTAERIDFFREKGLKALTRKAVADHYLKLRKLEAEARAVPELEAEADRLALVKKEFARMNRWVIAPVRLRQWLWQVKQRVLK